MNIFTATCIEVTLHCYHIVKIYISQFLMSTNIKKTFIQCKEKILQYLIITILNMTKCSLLKTVGLSIEIISLGLLHKKH